MLFRSKNDSNTPLLNFSFGYDQLNELTNSDEAINDNDQTYSYASKRIASVSGSADMPTASYQYDGSGRLTGKDNNAYNYDASNCPVTITGDNMQYSIEQDACGRLLSRTVNGNTTSFVYAASGDLLSISSGGSVLREMLYDESGNRITETFPDGSNIVYVSPAFRVYTDSAGNSTNVKNMMDSAGIVASIGSDTFFYRRDQKKDVTHIFDSTGALQSAFAFDGFGIPIPLSTGGDAGPLYEGRVLDQGTGLYYFGARYYDPVAGTFLTPDSRLGAANKLTPGAWNRFAFELNNPVNHTDPSGHSVWGDIGLGVGLVALVAVTAVALVVTVPTGGASDAVAADLDVTLGSIELTDLGMDFGADAAADAGAEAGADASAEAGAEAGTSAATETSGSITRTVWNVGVRLGTNAVKGAVTGALINGAEYEAEEVLSGSWGSWSGLLSAMEKGAISGAVSGVVSGALTNVVNISDYSLFGRIVATGAIGAVASVEGNIVSTEIMDKQFPTVGSLASSAASGFVSGVVTGKGNITAAKNYFFPPAAKGPIEIEMMEL